MTEHSYRFREDQCDVSDRVKLSQYRTKRSEWMNWLTGDEEHAIWKQIYRMLWSDAVFRTINESRHIVQESGASAALNGMMAGFIDKGYVAAQVLAIRRLTESEARSAKWQIISLRRLVDDIKKNSAIITREIYICHDGQLFDYDAVEQGQMKEIITKKNNVNGAYWQPAEGPKASSRRMHEAFDKLSGVTAENRSRDDKICEQALNLLDEELKESGYKDIIEYGNKFIAHAADDYSRSTLLENQTGLTLKRLEHCHQKLCGVARLIYGQILWESNSILIPVPQYGHLNLLDKPWVPAEKLPELYDFWNKHVQSVEDWETGELDFRPT